MDVYVRLLPNHRGLTGEVYVASSFTVKHIQNKYHEYRNFQQMGGEEPLSYDDYKSLHVVVRMPVQETVPVILPHALVKKLENSKHIRVVSSVSGKHLIAEHKLRQHLARTRFMD